ncbi:MAG: TraR/DksA C4-type zinc finger protein [Gemmatales bacterium]|nr:TraR/DksA C4-type zinc finger protein [Gemmatales bacterium]MDW7995280.1 TraR/DksA C4-type zinc finger protein [Gemmatales bacterium]
MKKDHGKESPRKPESRKTSGLKAQELEFFKKLLQDLRQRYARKVEDLAEEAFTPDAGGVSASPSHLGDVGFDYYSQDVSLDLLQSEREVLWEIDEALSRIANGTYGLCEECGEPIARERLELLPYTRYCIHCARKLESES